MELYSLDQALHQIIDPSLTLHTWQGDGLKLADHHTHWGFVYQGNPQFYRRQYQQAFTLYPLMYFCLPGSGCIGGRNSSGLVISCPQVNGMFSLGGPVESAGRFAYIDGGTNSLLIPPNRLGDPCLNALYFPPGCDQTLHTHPSYRIGIVLEGEGEAETPHTTLKLRPGIIFKIPPNGLHKFRTKNTAISLVVFHPDSDVGFTHRNNPMLNRTMVDGVSAAKIPEIHTHVDL